MPDAGRGRWDLTAGDSVATRVLVVLIAVVYPLVEVVPGLLGWVRGRPLDWQTTLAQAGPAVPALESTGVHVTYADAALWHIDDPSILQRLCALLPAVLTAVLLAAGCAIAWRLVGEARRGEPFGQHAVRRLRVLAVLVLAYGVLVPAVGVVAGVAITSSIDPSGSVAVEVAPGPVAVPVAIGLLVLVVAECFRAGTRLRDDVDGLV